MARQGGGLSGRAVEAGLRGTARIKENGSRILQAKIVVKLSSVQAQKWPGKGGAFPASPNHLILYETLLHGCPDLVGHPAYCRSSYDLIMA